MVYNPLEQFDIIFLSSTCSHFAITNFNIVLFLSFFIILLILSTNPLRVFSVSPFSFFIFLSFNFVKGILSDNLKVNNSSFIFIFYFLFWVIFLSNLVGMLPYSLTLTSHLFFTFYYALAFFIGINFIGVLHHNEKYFALFLPDGVPYYIVPFLIPIEYISYFSRVFSLSIRLFANMMSGHILLKILVGFIWSGLSGGSLFSILSFFPFLVIFFVTGLEFAIAALQSYVFIVLLSIYLNDVINLH